MSQTGVSTARVSDKTAGLNGSGSGRSRLPIPREHGAWFMLGHCLVLGALVARTASFPLVAMMVASALVFIGMQGWKQLARRRRAGDTDSGLSGTSQRFFLAAALVGGATIVLWSRWSLLFWILPGLGIGGLYGWAIFDRRERSTIGEWLGILGITSAAGVTWTAATAELGPDAFLLWGLSALYFGGSVPYVKLRVRQIKTPPDHLRNRLRLGAGAITYFLASAVLVLLGTLSGAYAWIAVLPFALAGAKAIAATLRGRGPRRIAHVGYAEVFYSTVFTVLTVAAFW